MSNRNQCSESELEGQIDNTEAYTAWRVPLLLKGDPIRPTSRINVGEGPAPAGHSVRAQALNLAEVPFDVAQSTDSHPAVQPSR
jgi:hypothetical protein